MNNTVLGVLAHVDAGKTTLSEEILYRGGALRTMGRVDRQTAYLDYSQVERERGITVFSDQADILLDERPFTLIDTPGHVDFSGEMERCLSVLDCAVLVVSAVEGVQAHTETLWELLRDRKIPVFLFINKTDRAGASVPETLEQLQSLGAGKACLFTGGISQEGDFSDSLRESLAETDDRLLELYLNGDFRREPWLKRARELVRGRRLFPAFSGSALKSEGVEELLWGLKLLAPSFEGSREEPFSGRVYKVRRDKGGRVCFLKVLQGTLHPKDEIQVPGNGETSEGEREKCGELRKYSGPRFHPAQEAEPGELCAVTGLRSSKPGDRVGLYAGAEGFAALQPLLSAKILYDEKKTPPPVMLSRLRELEEEEPLLHVGWSEQAQEITVRVMGEIQLEVLRELVEERWGDSVSFGPRSVLYAETLKAPVVGVGHFEPLRHYAEVHLLLSPGPRGSGIVFKSRCAHDFLAPNWQNLIRTHVLEKQHKGVLTGAPLTDVEITLLSGRAHLKHTEGGDFREAVYRAIRQGLMMGESVLLEPYYVFSAQVGLEEAGRVQADMAKLGAQCEAPETVGNRVKLRGQGPVRTLMDYPKELTAFTKGRGRIAFRFGGYAPCRDEEKIVAEAGYDPERDLENTPDSVFCSHGAGYTVKWRDAPQSMHLPLEKA